MDKYKTSSEKCFFVILVEFCNYKKGRVEILHSNGTLYYGGFE